MIRTKSGPIFVVLTCLTAALLFARSGHTDETQKKEGDQPSASESAESSQPAAKPTRRPRLPNHYGKLGLSDEQKQQVYAIQAKYQPQLDELQEKIRALQIERRMEINTVLTKGQKQRLKEIVRQAKEQRQKRKAARESAEASTEAK